MHLTALDWILVALPFAGLIALSLYTRRYVKGAADFIAAGRCAGRYLLTNARGEATSGVTATVSYFELFLVAGFIVSFWSTLRESVLLIIAISGFVVYRYRQTRALTVAQFFEMRYSRPFRIFMGVMAFLAGLLNYGVFPQVAAKFFVYYLMLPPAFAFGPFTFSTEVTIMATYLSLSCLLVTMGGQITNMVTDCLEGLLSHLIYVVLIVVLISVVSWERIAEVLSGAVVGGAESMQIDAGFSPINPFDAFKTQDFNFTYVALGLFITIFTIMTWQGGHGFNSAARTPHESRMSQVLSQWRLYARMLVLVVVVVCVITFLRHPDFAQQAAPAKAEVEHLHLVATGKPSDSTHPVGSQRWVEDKDHVSQLERQQLTTVALRYLLPSGIAGLFLLMMVLALFASDGNHQHSWSTIFVQDVYLPLRSVWWERFQRGPAPPLTQSQHVRILRGAVLGVGLFAFSFSYLVQLKVPIWMWFAITGAVYTAGAGCVIIGGLYWRRGTTAGAWAGMLTGSICSCSMILLDYNWAAVRPALSAAWQRTFGADPELPARFWLNPQWHAAISISLAVTAYVVVSVISGRRRPTFDLEGMLRREPAGALAGRVRWWERMLGVDREFTRGDRITTYSLFAWNISLSGSTLVLVIWHYGVGAYFPELRMSASEWMTYWGIFGLGLPFLISIVTLIWFSWGSYGDLKHFFHQLRTGTRDTGDDGTVRDSRDS